VLVIQIYELSDFLLWILLMLWPCNFQSGRVMQNFTENEMLMMGTYIILF